MARPGNDAVEVDWHEAAFQQAALVASAASTGAPLADEELPAPQKRVDWGAKLRPTEEGALGPESLFKRGAGLLLERQVQFLWL